MTAKNPPETPETPFLSVEDAVKRFRNGEMLIVVDDENRENEGDLICAGELVTPEIINFMARRGRGLVCAPTTAARLEELNIPHQTSDNSALHGTAFMVTIDAVAGTTTGISAQDRAITIRKMADPKARPRDFARPGHVFPLQAVNGGVLRRAGHTEATVDLTRLANMFPVGVLCEIMSDDGSMARLPELIRMAREENLGIVTIESLIAYRRRHEILVERIVDVNLPTRYGDFRMHLYGTKVDNENHFALVKGRIDPEEPILVRVHSSCLTGDLLSSLLCDCGDQLQTALAMIEQAGNGVFLYMMQEGRGIGLANKIRAYKLQQEEHLDTVEANTSLGFKPDQRDYGFGAQILFDLGVRKMRLMTNNPQKRVGLEAYGLMVVERVPLWVGESKHNVTYLQTKREKMGHEK